MWIELLIVLALTVANGIFSGAELAILSVRKTRLQEMVESGSRRARAVSRLRDTPERFLATVQIGITVIGASAGAFGGSTLAARLVGPLQSLGLGDSAEEISFALVVAFISYLSLVLGELVPKSLGLKFSEGYAMLIAQPLEVLAKLGRPLVWFLTSSSNAVLKLFGDSTNFMESRISPEELQQMVEEATKSGGLHPRAGELASRAFELNDVTVADVMMPRSRMVVLPRNADADEVRRIWLEEGHSRMPVYDGSIDNVVGYVIAKDALALYWEKDLIRLDDVLRPAFFLPEATRVVDALNELQRRRTQLALVVDELGSVRGLITIEDLVEEMVGEIFSEHEIPPELVRQEPSGSVVVQGGTPIRDLNRVLDLDLPEGEDFSTIAGYVLSLAQAIPEKGMKFEAKDGWNIEVVDASSRRVRTVRLTPPPPKPAEEGEGDAES